MGVRKFRGVCSCSVKPGGETVFTLKSAFGLRVLIYEGLGAKAGWEATYREV